MGDLERATAQARQPALVASLPEPVPVSAHAGDGQAQGCLQCDRLREEIADYMGHRTDNIAGKLWAAQHLFSRFEGELEDLIGDFERLTSDDYDCSLEIKGAVDEMRLSEEAQRLIQRAGFGKVYVNHLDGWETHYTFGAAGELPVRGWRRRYVSDPTADTTNVIAGPENNGYFEISYWPDGWKQRGWLDTGYMRIVPDPLDTFASVDTHPQGGDAKQAPCASMGSAVRDSADAMPTNPTPKGSA